MLNDEHSIRRRLTDSQYKHKYAVIFKELYKHDF